MKRYNQTRRKTINLIGFNVSYFVFIIGIIFAAATVFTTIQTVTSSAKLAYLETEELKLNKKNEELNSNLIENSSLSSLSKTAENLGFIKPQHIFYSQEAIEIAKLP